MKNYLNTPWCRFSIIIILVLGLTLASIQLFAKTSFKYDSFSFNLSTKIGINGGTSIVIPPVGQLFLKSHATPWQIIITLDEIDFVKLEKQLESLPPKQEWLKVLQNEVLKALLMLFLKMFFVGLTSSALLLLAFRIKPRSKFFIFSLLASFLLIFLLIGTTILTYDETAINRPEYQGVLASAPWAMNLVTMSLDNIEVIGTNLKKVSQSLSMLYKQAGQIKNMGEFQTDLAVLHISDIHNNPAAYDFISELAENFEISFIIDTGDLTDYGTALEAELIEKISNIKIPYVYIPGNHDSPLIIDRLKKLKSVIIIDSQNIRLSGITIAGQSDPASQSYNSDVAPIEEMENAREKLVQQIDGMKTFPQIVAVHNRMLAEPFIGKVPLILHGHDHRYQLTQKDGTVISDAGTTGAAGLRGLTPKGVPYSATIIYWKQDADGELQLHAVDSIKIDGVQGKLSINRNTYTDNNRNP